MCTYIAGVKVNQRQMFIKGCEGGGGGQTCMLLTMLGAFLDAIVWDSSWVINDDQ